MAGSQFIACKASAMIPFRKLVCQWHFWTWLTLELPLPNLYVQYRLYYTMSIYVLYSLFIFVGYMYVYKYWLCIIGYELCIPLYLYIYRAVYPWTRVILYRPLVLAFLPFYESVKYNYCLQCIASSLTFVFYADQTRYEWEIEFNKKFDYEQINTDPT